MKKIKTIIVEDDRDWLKAITSFLKNDEDIEIIGTASSRTEVGELIRNVDADICLMDIDLNGNRCEGIYAAMDVMEIKNTKVIMLTSLKDDDIILDSFTAGAVDYVNKENYREIPLVIKRAFFAPTYTNTLIAELGRLKKQDKLKSLSHSERELFEYLEKGYTQSQIEKVLFKTKSTIKVQVKSILRKLNVRNSKEAVHKLNSKELINKSDDSKRL